jgi:ABC-type proline/glycine betaine transport system ATPase subunit
MRIGDRIAVMEGGRVVQVGTPEEILRNPSDDYLSSFFRGVDTSKVLTARDVARTEHATLIDREGTGIRAALKQISVSTGAGGTGPPPAGPPLTARQRAFVGVFDALHLQSCFDRKERRMRSVTTPWICLKGFLAALLTLCLWSECRA